MTMVNVAALPEDVVRICRLSGAQLEKEKSRLDTLRESRKFLEQSIHEARAAEDSHKFFRTAELVARVVLVACDASIKFAESHAGPAGMIVGRAYSGGQLAVSALSGDVSSGQVWQLVIDNKSIINQKILEEAGKPGLGRAFGYLGSALGTLALIRDQVIAYEAGGSGDEGITAGRRTLEAQLERILFDISSAETELEACPSMQNISHA